MKLMKPMIIIPPDLINAENIRLLRANGVCVVVAKDPAKVRFMDPILAMSARNEIDSAAIRLSRLLLNGQYKTSNGGYLSRADFTKLFVEILVKGTSLDARGTQEEYEQRMFDDAKREEIYKLAREEARAERKAKREAKKAEEKK